MLIINEVFKKWIKCVHILIGYVPICFNVKLAYMILENGLLNKGDKPYSIAKWLIWPVDPNVAKDFSEAILYMQEKSGEPYLLPGEVEGLVIEMINIHDLEKESLKGVVHGH